MGKECLDVDGGIASLRREAAEVILWVAALPAGLAAAVRFVTGIAWAAALAAGLAASLTLLAGML